MRFRPFWLIYNSLRILVDRKFFLGSVMERNGRILQQIPEQLTGGGGVLGIEATLLLYCEHEFQQFNVVCITDFATKYGHPYGRSGQARHRTGG